jgi:hypothetical protein
MQSKDVGTVSKIVAQGQKLSRKNVALRIRFIEKGFIPSRLFSFDGHSITLPIGSVVGDITLALTLSS